MHETYTEHTNTHTHTLAYEYLYCWRMGFWCVWPKGNRLPDNSLSHSWLLWPLFRRTARAFVSLACAVVVCVFFSLHFIVSAFNSFTKIVDFNSSDRVFSSTFRTFFMIMRDSFDGMPFFSSLVLLFIRFDLVWSGHQKTPEILSP